MKARRRDVSPVVRVGDRPFVRHPDPRRARWRGDARSGGAGGSAARFRARIAGCLHVADASSPPRRRRAGSPRVPRRAAAAGAEARATAETCRWDSSRDDSGARNDYWRGGAGGSEGRRGRGGGGRGSYARAEGDRGASPSRGARGRGRGDGKRATATHAVVSNRPAEAGTRPRTRAPDRRHGGRGGRGGGGGGRGRNVEPCSALAAERKNKMRQHTGTLSSCESCDAVLEYASEHARTFTAVNFSTAIHKLGKLNRSARGRRTKHAARLIDDPRFADLETALAASLALSRPPTRRRTRASPSSTASGARARCPARCGASPTAAGPRRCGTPVSRRTPPEARSARTARSSSPICCAKSPPSTATRFRRRICQTRCGRWRRCTAARRVRVTPRFLPMPNAIGVRSRTKRERTLRTRSWVTPRTRWRARSATGWRARRKATRSSRRASPTRCGRSPF